MIVDQGSPVVLNVNGSTSVEPMVLRGEVRNYPIRVGEVLCVWATEPNVSRCVVESSAEFRVVGVESVCSDGVVVSVCRHPCIVDGCPCMRVLLEPYEVLVPVWWVFWSPLAWYVVSFFAEY